MNSLTASFLVPILLGFGLNWALQGILSIQVYIYYLCFPKDTIYMKGLVHFMCVYEWAQTAITTWSICSCLGTDVEGFLNFVAFNGTIWIPMFLMTVVTAAGVQAFYAWRIAVVSQRRVFAFITLSSATVAFGFGIAGSLEMKGLPLARGLYLGLDTTYAIGLNTWLTCSVAVDLLITVTLVYSLRKMDARMERRANKFLVNRIMWVVIETGCPTVIAASASVIFYFGLPKTSLATLPLLLLSKLYANAVMVTLNNRALMYIDVPASSTTASLFFSQVTARRGSASSSSKSPVTDLPVTTETRCLSPMSYDTPEREKRAVPRG